MCSQPTARQKSLARNSANVGEAMDVSRDFCCSSDSVYTACTPAIKNNLNEIYPQKCGLYDLVVVNNRRLAIYVEMTGKLLCPCGAASKPMLAAKSKQSSMVCFHATR